MSIFLKALIAGFAIAAPIGPASILTMRRAASNTASGVFSGLGAATADVVHAVLAILGVAAVADLIVSHGWAMRGGAAIALLGMAVFSFRKRRDGPPAPVSALSLASDWASSLALTVMNPGTLLGFVAIFAGLGIAVRPDSAMEYVFVIGGVLLGSVLWWMGLALGSRLVGARLRPVHLRWIDRVTGALFLIGGVALAGSAFV